MRVISIVIVVFILVVMVMIGSWKTTLGVRVKGLAATANRGATSVELMATSRSAGDYSLTCIKVLLLVSRYIIRG